MRDETPTGYLRCTYVSPLDDSAQRLALWVPPGYSPRKQYPILIALHGMDGDERMIPEQCWEIHERGFSEDMILLSVFGRGDIAFEGPGEADFWEALQWVKDRYRINPHRQYLTGLSMGGYAVWRLAADYPEQWAAIAPVCGGGDVNSVAALQDIPVWCVHGEQDPFVSVEESRRLVAEMRRLRYECRYDELAGWGHNAWDWLYDPDRRRDGLVEWLLQHRREQVPPPVRAPRRKGGFKDLFQERILISYPSKTAIPGEGELLRAEAERVAGYSFGDYVMRSGRLLVRADHEISPSELVDCNHLMFGRNDNHLWLGKVDRKLVARHVRGTLRVDGEPYLGKSLIAATCQTSPWNSARLLGVVTYQQCNQVRGIAERLCGPAAEPLAVNLFDTTRRRFILQKGL